MDAGILKNNHNFVEFSVSFKSAFQVGMFGTRTGPGDQSREGGKGLFKLGNVSTVEYQKHSQAFSATI